MVFKSIFGIAHYYEIRQSKMNHFESDRSHLDTQTHTHLHFLSHSQPVYIDDMNSFLNLLWILKWADF